MSGDFSKSSRPTRPGGYFHFQASIATPPQPGLAGIVAIPFTNDWGPSEVPVLLRSFADYQNVFGLSINTVGYRDVYQAFEGEGLPGYGGAGAVLAYRMSGSSAAKASHSFTNTTPAAALTLTAIYEGTRGNSLNVTIQAAAGIANTDQLIIYDGSTQLESYLFPHTATDVVALAAAINAASQWVTATSVISGVPLTYVANAALTGGLGGETLITADWTNMLAAIQVQQFAVIGAEWPTADSATMTALLAWVIAMRSAGKMFRVVIGGLLNESSTTAIARSASFNHEAVVNIGQGSVQDSTLGVLSTSMLAPKIAGIVAARGESMSLTYARLAGTTILVGATDAEIALAFAGGLIVLARDSNLNAPVRIDKGVSTYTTTTNPAKPYLIYRNPKFIATMDGIQTELTSFAEQNVIGKMEVNPSSRAFVRSQISQTLRQREAQGIVQPGWTVADDFNPPATPQDEFMQFAIALTFGRSAEQVFFTASVG